MTKQVNRPWQPLVNSWQKAFGPKPTHEQFAQAAALAPRGYGKQTVALAQALAAGAAGTRQTADMMLDAAMAYDVSVGAPCPAARKACNQFKPLVRAGDLTGSWQACALTDKGLARIAKAVDAKVPATATAKATDKPAPKAGKVAKVRKPKAPKAVPVAAVADPVEPHPSEAVEAREISAPPVDATVN